MSQWVNCDHEKLTAAQNDLRTLLSYIRELVGSIEAEDTEGNEELSIKMLVHWEGK